MKLIFWVKLPKDNKKFCTVVSKSSLCVFELYEEYLQCFDAGAILIGKFSLLTSAISSSMFAQNW